MKDLLVDCKHALRLYRRTPVSSLIAVAILAVGIAFVGAFLALYVDLALKPFRGIEDSGRLVSIAAVEGQTIRFEITERMAEEVTSLEAVVGVALAPNLAVGRDGETATVEVASRGFFDGIRPRLARGRGFEPAETDPGFREGVGLRNVRARLEQMYGEDHRFTIDGAPGEGTRITIDLPRIPAAPERLAV